MTEVRTHLNFCFGYAFCPLDDCLCECHITERHRVLDELREKVAGLPCIYPHVSASKCPGAHITAASVTALIDSIRGADTQGDRT